MIHVGLSVKMHGSPFATDSSPMKLQGKQRVNIFEKKTLFKNSVGSFLAVSPVRSITKLLFQRPDDDFLHLLVSLCHQVYVGALGLDLHFALACLSDDLQVQPDENPG